MTSTTVEKAAFVLFGLAIFSAIGIPIFNAIQEIVVIDASTHDFDNMVGKIELGLRVVEYNGSSAYSSPLEIREGTTVAVIADSWGIEVEYSGTEVHLVKSIYSRTCPITLFCEVRAGACELNIEMINGFIVIRFLKEGM